MLLVQDPRSRILEASVSATCLSLPAPRSRTAGLRLAAALRFQSTSEQVSTGLAACLHYLFGITLIILLE